MQSRRVLGVQSVIVGLVILSLVSSDVPLVKRARSAPSPSGLFTHPNNQPQDLPDPRGGGPQWLGGETQLVRRALPLTSHGDSLRETAPLVDTAMRRAQGGPQWLGSETQLVRHALPLTSHSDSRRETAPLVDAAMRSVQKDDTLDDITRLNSRRVLDGTRVVRQALPDAARATDQEGTITRQCAGVTPAPMGTGKLIWPTDSHQVGGNPYAWWHRGIDLAGALDDPVYAADAGVVIRAGPDTQGYGLLIILDHGNGWQTLYAHLSQIHVECGQSILQGAVIGAVGSTGHSTAPHLHFEVRLNGDPSDPCLLLTEFVPTRLPDAFNASPGAPIGPWLGRYYENMSLEGEPTLARTDPVIDFDWGYGSPGNGMPKGMWSARWTGVVDLAAGTYRFHTIADDGVRVFVDGQVVIDKWQDTAGVEYVGGKALASGNHTVKVEYYQKGHQARIKLWWEKLR